jgi:hypothetical protein
MSCHMYVEVMPLHFIALGKGGYKYLPHGLSTQPLQLQNSIIVENFWST